MQKEREDIIAELKEMWYDFQKRTEKTKRELIREVESKSETILKNSKQEYREYQEKINSAKKDLDSINITRTVLIEELEKIEIENQNLKQITQQTNEEKSMMELIFKRISAIFPNECVSILKEIENERK